MKQINTHGITYLEPLQGSSEWYWGTDYASGDLYEAEELFRQGHPFRPNQLVFVHYPDGTVHPLAAQEGQYWERPIFYNNEIVTLLVDFQAGTITMSQFQPAQKQEIPLAVLPLSDVEDCYNLMLETAPLMLTRQGNDNTFQILWPEKVKFDLEETEAFLFRIGKMLYFSVWYEDPGYREEVIVRDMLTGEITERFPGNIMVMPDGQRWLLSP